MILHETRMRELIAFTRKNSLIEPHGCSIYNESGEMLASVIGNKESPINHAEVLAINECARKFPKVKWNTVTLYTTGEPCCMCASACCWANVKEIVYATDIPFMIDLWNIESPKRAIDIIQLHPKKPRLVADICKEESNQLFSDRRDVFAKACMENRWL